MILDNIVLPINYTDKELEDAVRKALKKKKIASGNIKLLRRSIDARKKPDLKYVCKIAVNEPEPGFSVPEMKEKKRIVVCGSGPAGLFTSLILSQAGAEVILTERGQDVDKRTEDVNRFWETGKLNSDSNVQFGEGGAGTFSDGKLNTLIKDKEHYGHFVLKTFYEHGAEKEILYDAKPHIGTDVLRKVIKNIRKTLILRGVDVRFNSCLKDIDIEDNTLKGVYLNDEYVPCDALVLAVGHSARDTFEMLYEKGLQMEQKPFACGIRIEHPRDMITLSQYGTLDYEELGAASYKLTAKASNGRGVYTFCMCPGGYVVNASSEERHLCINGMSLSSRSSNNSNSGIVVQIYPSDYPGDHPLDGVRFQRELEERAYNLAEGRIPVQKFGDFLKHRKTESYGEIKPEMKGEAAFSDLNGLFPKEVEEALKEGIKDFGKRIRGFDREDCLISAVEARTSCPLRIERNEDHEASVRRIYPAGEGAGYAGGIMSAAIDGIKTALKIIR